MIRKPNQGRVPRAVGSVAVLVLFLLTCTVRSYSQRCESRAIESFIASHGANELIELRGVNVRTVRGHITDVNGARVTDAVIDVFPMDNKVRRELLGTEDANEEAFKSFRVDTTGEFCLDLPPGTYELRFGTEGFGFKQTKLSVTKIRSGSRKPIDIVLEPGT